MYIGMLHRGGELRECREAIQPAPPHVVQVDVAVVDRACVLLEQLARLLHRRLARVEGEADGGRRGVAHGALHLVGVRVRVRVKVRG